MTDLSYGDLKFAYWQDTGAQTPLGLGALGQDTTLVAVYDET